MSLIARAMRRFHAATTASDIYAAIIEQSRSGSGKSVTVDSALRVAAVFACIRVIAEGIAQVPLEVFVKKGLKNDPALDHPLYDVLYRKTNKVSTSFEWRETTALHAALTGDAFSFKIRGLGNRIAELIQIEPGDVTVIKPDNYGEQPEYSIQGKTEAKKFTTDEILHIKGPSWNSVEGLDAVKTAREAIGLSIATEENHANFHGSGARVSGLYSVEGTLEKQQHTQLREWIDTEYGGSNKNRTMILDRGAKFTQMSMTGVDSQHLETRRFQIEDVCRFFRVMPIMVMQSDKAATYASAEQMFLAHVIHTLMPWYERLEQAFDTQLLTKEERSTGLYTKFDHTALLRGDMKTISEYLKGLCNLGILTRNEGRAMLGKNPLDGLDEPLTPVNLDGGSENAQVTP